VDGISSTFREEQKCIQECGRETYRKGTLRRPRLTSEGNINLLIYSMEQSPS